ncbi:DODA-type extradiol aromatic ring-opening family dioxygenase [Simiduia aestuariiviva]|uniref:Aromatic ring-opening dioxygenase catalytic subunit (LigB family) n=1 Tax=Simiduia aestuariiviva TaxID=1510459 RepID=A0A839UHV9_9GAMM|nr:class III extradiol ring-cleavage dioxygenase [Simiduia aestuariiviva]MBB3167442.1 aromatic ring-opening dioxygenase catalytic subunit (LigB family) [Simiduia aestuariiviva]
MNIAFVSHGGGPLPVLGDPDHAQLRRSFALLRSQLPAHPSVVVVVSAHWEARGFQINAAAQPPLLFDYQGFPAESYQLSYPAPGQPELAASLIAALNHWGLAAQTVERGWDHGVFVPLLLLYPAARIPVLQVSLDASLDPAMHWRLGQALARGLPADALLLGSGFSFHNLPAFFGPKSAEVISASDGFAHWLDRTLVTEWQSATVESTLSAWQEAPHARFNHPREEHLLPLLVCAAAAKGPAQVQRFEVMGVAARNYFWAESSQA